MNRLQSYLKTNGETQKMFAERLGLTQGGVSMIADGKRRPSIEVAFRIAEATNGAVPVESWAEQILRRGEDASSQNEKRG